MTKFRRWISEQFVPSWGGLRSAWRMLSGQFFPTRPAYDKTTVTYDYARQLYRNDGTDTHLGAGFCKPIIDRAVEFMGIPVVSSDDEERDNFLNTAIERYWKPRLIEMFRNSMRDSKAVIRVWQPLLDDPLASEEERKSCQIDILNPEQVQISYNPRNPYIIDKAVIVNYVEFPDDRTQPQPDPQRGARQQIREHEIWEVITPEQYRYYDRSDNKWLDSWSRPNPDGFVTLIEVWNEYDSTLGGGQSDLESPLPFIKAFHNVAHQALSAHAYHSTPKLSFKVADIVAFLKNNFPDTLDENGQIVPGSTITWKGREVLFIGEEDEIGFIEAESVLGDSKTLLEFLIDCIAVASETPEWAFMRVESGTSQGSLNAQTIPYEKKIERKRNLFTPYVQRICKMALVMNGQAPETVDILWEEIRVESLLNLTQAMQQFVMTLEVLLERRLISENTAREALRQFRVFRTMKSPSIEEREAADNLSLEERAAELDAKLNGGGNGRVPRERVPAVTGRTGGGENE